MTVSTAPRTVVAGGGVIGLAVALRLASRGASVTLLAPQTNGAASPASAGMLAPSVERAQGPAQDFSDASREAWDRFAAFVRDEYGPTIPVHRDGIVRIARTDADAERVRATLRRDDTWMTEADVARVIPGVAGVVGGAHYPGDGYVDVPTVLASLVAAARKAPSIAVVELPATLVESRAESVRVGLDGSTLDCDLVVVAAGVWSAGLPGLDAARVVRPVRGGMVAVGSLPPEMPVYDAEGHVYLVPRAGETVVGATSEEAGFDAAPRESDAEGLIARAAGFVPGLKSARRSRPWAGLRPMTPDGLALIGSDQKDPRILYACGHGRNGYLQAALTAEVIAGIAFGDVQRIDISPFAPGRFLHQ
ncbi:MAG TPA: FAD-dependent oxidoreductase [Gemmatimonadaceae bacterium]|nr:FAD-dependent oxidoreductase [Gemmatimonadaceae bacterium]